MKRLFSLSVFLMMALLSFAHDFEVGGIYYWITSSSAPYTVAVTCKGTSWNQYSNEYTGDVTIPESVSYDGNTYSVTSIGIQAFKGCIGLTSITIPNSVTSIGNSAFSDCSGLKSVTIPSSVTSIGSGAFAYCSGLTSIEIPNSVTSIGQYAFRDCSGLTSVTIGNSVTSIGSYAFYECSGLTSVTIPNSVTTIGIYAFYNCRSLTSVTIPNSVTTIGIYAFYNCRSLTSIEIPNSVTSIGSSAFRGCSGLTKVIVPDIAAWCKISFESNSANPLYYAKHIYSDANTEITDLVIPNSVTSIGSSAFYGCSGLTSITIPNSVTTIGSWAFYGCSSLTSVTIPNSVTSIGDDAFYGTVWYNNQPEGLIYLGKVAYKYKGTMPKNTVIDLEEGTTEIASKAFYNCSGLTFITIPNSVTSIGSSAFYGCSGLIQVNIPNSVTTIGGSAFSYCSGLSTVILPDDFVSIGNSAFPNKSTTRLYVNIGSKTLLALWNGGYDYVYEKGTQNRLQPSSTLYLSSSTQTSVTFNIDSKYSGYTFTCDGNNIIAVR